MAPAMGPSSRLPAAFKVAVGGMPSPLPLIPSLLSNPVPGLVMPSLRETPLPLSPAILVMTPDWTTATDRAHELEKAEACAQRLSEPSLSVPWVSDPRMPSSYKQSNPWGDCGSTNPSSRHRSAPSVSSPPPSPACASAALVTPIALRNHEGACAIYATGTTSPGAAGGPTPSRAIVGTILNPASASIRALATASSLIDSPLGPPRLPRVVRGPGAPHMRRAIS